MEDILIFDIVIIGGGPAGTTAGITAVKLGLKVCIIDKSTFPRDKLCGGLVTDKSFEVLEELSGNLKREELYDYKSNYVELFHKTRKFAQFNTEIPLYFVNRNFFDNKLMDEFIRLGGVLKNHKIILSDINQIESEITIGNERISYKFLFGADGSNSIVRKLLDSDYKSNGLCVECDLNDEDFPDHLKGKIQIYFGIIEKGYGWVFPKDGKMTIGIGGSIENIKDIKSSFKEFLLTLGIRKEVEYTGATVPYGKYPKNISTNNILLIGDSAGLVDPITGEGIYFSIYSGKAASESVSEYINGKIDNVSHAYSNEIKYVYNHINAGKWLHGWMFNRFIQNKLFKMMNGHNSICKYFIDKVVSRYEYTYRNLLRIVINYRKDKKLNK